MTVRISILSHSTGWRIATVLLIFALGWDALDPMLQPPHIYILGSHFILGFVCTAAFPNRAWIGALIALFAAVGFEILQGVVPLRDVRVLELLGKWGAALCGVLFEVALSMFRQYSNRNAS